MTDTSTTTSSAKKLVVSAFAEFTRGNTDILRSVLAPHLIEHSPGNPSGRDAFIKHILNQPVADASLDLKRVIADGDLVALHYHLVPNGGGRGLRSSTSGESKATRSSSTGMSSKTSPSRRKPPTGCSDTPLIRATP